VIFVDSNLPMYLVGSPHPNRIASQRAVEGAIAAEERLVTDAEVVQEILHRYAAIGRRDAIQPAIDLLLGIVDEVFSIDLAAALRAREIVLGYSTLSARDAIHLAVMEREGITRILTFDAGFDGFPGIERLPA
jgi:predicted nucleic acid-binding protein